MNRLMISAVFASLVPFTAHAGEQFIDETTFAVSGYDVVEYFMLEQSPLGVPQPAGVPGLANITAEYNGATFAFSSEENRDVFLVDPAAYVPKYDGHCAYGVAQGGKVPGNPNLWRIVDGELFLNITEVVAGFWEVDISGNLQQSQINWTTIESMPASTRTIPQFTSAAPLTNGG
jgi:YHS domain-containing protein